jgi:hypothetical protein
LVEVVMKKSEIKTIITHPGAAHRDEFMAVSLLIALNPQVNRVLRKNPEKEDEGKTFVVDIGGVYDGETRFDHHQMVEKDKCAITLVLEAAGLLPVAYEVLPWLRPTEVRDCRGPGAVAEFLSTTPEVVEALESPIEGFILGKFREYTEIIRGEDCLFWLMEETGKTILEKIRGWEGLVADFRKNTTVTDVGGVNIADVTWAASPLPVWKLAKTLESPIQGFVGRNFRGGPGEVTITRLGDKSPLDFRKIQGMPGVKFVHTTGFLSVVAVDQFGPWTKAVEMARIL